MDEDFLGTDMMRAEESSLSSWAGPYVTEMLGRGQALAGMPYQAYMGPLTAGQSGLQTQAFQGLAGLNIPTNQQMTYNPMSFTGMPPPAPTAQQTVMGGLGTELQNLPPLDLGYAKRQSVDVNPLDYASAQEYYAAKGIPNPFMESRIQGGRSGPNGTIIYGDERDQWLQRNNQPPPSASTDPYAGLFKALGMAPPTAQQGQMPSSIFEGLGGTVSGAALDSSLAVQRDIPSYMQGNFGFSGTNTVEDQAKAREMVMKPLQPMQQSPIEQYMSPYLQGALDPQYAAAQRQADIAAQNLQSQYGKAGAYGGSRQGVAEAELQRGLLDRMAGITGTGYQQAFEQAQRQFNEEQRRQMDAANQAQRYGLDVLREQQAGGATQRGIESQGIAADIAQFEQERDYPKSNTLFMQSLLQGLPLETQSYSYIEPTGLASLTGGIGGVTSILDTLGEYFGGGTGGQASQAALDAIANQEY
jgi:hypothetical protein